MYTVSNPCGNPRRFLKFKTKSEKETTKEARQTSNYFDLKGNTVELKTDEELLNNVDEPEGIERYINRSGALTQKELIYNGNYKESPGLYAYDL